MEREWIEDRNVVASIKMSHASRGTRCDAAIPAAAGISTSSGSEETDAFPEDGRQRPAAAVQGLISLLSKVLLFALVFLLPATLRAQFRGSIQGVVTDPTGAVIPGATVTLTDTATNQTVTVTSSRAGVYTFNALAPAPYTMTVTAPGFKTKTIANIQITPEQANSINVQLTVGQAEQTVSVSAENNMLHTETATESVTIDSNQIQHMPSFDRDVFQLAQLAPGAFGDASQVAGGGTNSNPAADGPGGSGQYGSTGGIFSVSNGPQINTLGGHYETNSISVDGISTVSPAWGGTTLITPSEDSIQDFTIVTNAYDAENGRFSGAHMQVITKSGTNGLHGSAFFKASRPGLNAYQRWNGYVPGITGSSTVADKGVLRDEERTNNYGGSLGGPIWKNKIFAFFNFETSPDNSITTGKGWYETPQFDKLAQTSGVIGSIAKTYLSFPGNTPVTNGIISQTCAQIGLTEGVNCATIPGAGLDVGSPIKTGIGNQDLTYGGSSNLPGVGGGLDGVPDMALYNTVNPTNISQSQYNGRLDVNATQKDHVTFTIYWVPVTIRNYSGSVRSYNLEGLLQENGAFTGLWNHTFSPTLLNQARVNAAGYRYKYPTNKNVPLGLPSVGFDATPLTFFGVGGLGDFNEWTYTYNDVLSKTLGNQNIKIGGELTRLYLLSNPVFEVRPSYTFDNIWDFANDAPNFESGLFSPTTGTPTVNRQDLWENLLAFFVQDDYKVRPNLTMNAGLRWSYFGSLYSKQNNLGVVEFGSGSNALTGLHIRKGGSLYTPQKANFGPQLGFSWQPSASNGKAVFRGGAGINYNQYEIAVTANVTGNLPYLITASFTCPYPYTSNPSCAGSGILYGIASDVHSYLGYPPNPAAITPLGPDNLPVSSQFSSSVAAFQSHPKTVTTYHYSLQGEYQLPFDSVVSLGYMGSQTRHQNILANFNAIVIGNGVPINPKLNYVNYFWNGATGNYNALIATLRHQTSHHFTAEAQYTWSKSMDEGSGAFVGNEYPFDPRSAYGRSDFNVQNMFKLFGVWQPVFFHSSSWMEKVLGGWALSGIFNLHTGFPFDAVYNTVGQVYYQGSGYASLHPAAYRGGAGTKTGNSIFMGPQNPNYGGDATRFFVAPKYVVGPAFPAVASAPVPGIHRNSLTGPGYQDLDASLAKKFGLPNNRVLGENAALEVRVDTYNLFNKININGQTIDGLIGTANPDGTVASVNPHFGVPSSALGSRTVQLQARFSF